MLSPTRVTPQQVHHIPLDVLVTLLPPSGHNGTGHQIAEEVRGEFARMVTSPALRDCQSWQEAWNGWTGAGPGRPGIIRYTPARCAECRGRRYSTRNLSRNIARTGTPFVCGGCNGSGRGKPASVTALHAREPETGTTR